MQIVKHKRHRWNVEPGTVTSSYASLEMTGEYDVDGKWATGWHVFIRDKNGKIIGKGHCHKTGNLAAAEAIELLGA